jgi:NAD(P)-dependent dehydrogenase (short-subunit alcohol dehydrogenase family)
MTLAQRPRSVVTGAGGGLGRAFCLELAKRQARLVASDIRPAAAEETARLARDAGALEAHAVACDVSRPQEVEALAGEAWARLGGVDVLVNNAGVAACGTVGEVPLADWEWVFGVNQWGVVHGCHFFLPRMKRAGSGHVINVASAAGLLSAPEMGPYNMTKAAVVALSETLCGELSPLGIGVTVLCPTFFPTDIVKNSRGPNEELRRMGEAFMKRSKLDANGVARFALAAADRGKLYAVPMADGLWAWRAKRVIPEAYHTKLASAVMGAVRRRLAKETQKTKKTKETSA